MSARGGALALALAACAPAAAPAQVPCAPAAEIAGRLAAEFGEARRFAGLDGRGAVIELWVSGSGSWTLLALAPGGIACLAAAGTAGVLLPAPAAAPAGVPG